MLRLSQIRAQNLVSVPPTFLTVENCALLDYYAASSSNSLPMFRDNLSVPTWPRKMGPIGCPETSVRNYHHSLRNNPEERSHALLTVLHRQRQSFRTVLNRRLLQCSDSKFRNDVHFSHCSRRGSWILLVAWFETQSCMQLVCDMCQMRIVACFHRWSP
jgi:hypothetical protein